MSALISIIVPIYKTEKFLTECINSILAQTYKNIEVILIDNASPDHCGAICDAYAAKDSRVRVIHLKNNRGQGGARNCGLGASKGDYIMFVDSDDYIAPNMCEYLLSLSGNGDFDISICGFFYKYPDGKCVPYVNTHRKMSGYMGTYEYFRKNNIATVLWNKLYKRELFLNEPILYFPENERFEDHFMTYRLLYRAKHISIGESPLYYYVQRQGSVTHSIRDNDIIYHAHYIFDYYKWTDNEAPEFRPVVEYRCLCIFNSLVHSFVQSDDWPKTRKVLERLNNQILGQTHSVFSDWKLAGKSFRIYWLMKLHLLVPGKRMLFVLKNRKK